MLGLLPPSSRLTFFRFPAAALDDEPADLGRTGEGDLVDPFVGREGGAGRLAEPGDNVDHTVGKSGLGHDLGQVEGRQWRLLGRLEDDRFPVARAGPSFQAAMRSGKFHGMIWPTTPIGSRNV
jgi:hypothetical protein